ARRALYCSAVSGSAFAFVISILSRTGTLSFPQNLIENCTKPFAASRVDGLQEPYAPIEMRPEQRVCVAVLAVRTEPKTVGKRGLQPIEIFPEDVYALIR